MGWISRWFDKFLMRFPRVDTYSLRCDVCGKLSMIPASGVTWSVATGLPYDKEGHRIRCSQAGCLGRLV